MLFGGSQKNMHNCQTCAFCDTCYAWLNSPDNAVLVCPREVEATKRSNFLKQENEGFSEFINDLIMDFFRKGEAKNGKLFDRSRDL